MVVSAKLPSPSAWKFGTLPKTTSKSPLKVEIWGFWETSIGDMFFERNGVAGADELQNFRPFLILGRKSLEV